jgi:hypothetical protein
MRIQKKIVLAGVAAGIGWAAARSRTSQTLIGTVAARLVMATRRYKRNLLSAL